MPTGPMAEIVRKTGGGEGGIVGEGGRILGELWRKLA